MTENFLKKIRQEKNISAAKLSRKTGINPALISLFENGKGEISNSAVNKILKELDITKEYLFTHKDPIDEAKIIKATRMVHEYYHQSGFDDEEIVAITRKLYEKIVKFEKEKGNKTNYSEIISKLEDDYFNGLAAEIYSKYLKSCQKNEKK